MLERFTKAVSAALLALIFATPAIAQSSPGLIYGQVPTAAQWNSYFAAKQDVLGYRPVNKAGDFMLGKLITSPSSAAAAGLNLPAGTAPSSPVDGDMWTTSAGLFLRAGGTTYGPITGSSGCGGLPALSGFVTTPGGSCVTSLGATITVAQGGTGRTSLTTNSVLVGNGTSAPNFIIPTPASTRQYIGTSSSGAPTYSAVNFNELAGTLDPSQCPAATNFLIGCLLAPADPPAVHQFLIGYSGGWVTRQPTTSDISGFGTVATKNIGNSVADPGTGKLETLFPYEATSTGASKAFGASDLQFATRRSNSGSAMTDTFPASSATGMVNGAVIYVGNGDATATDTITAGSGTVFSAGATQTVTPGRGVMFVLDTTGGTPTWRSHNNDLNQVLAANNGTDFASPSTTLANLGGIGAASPALTGTFTAVNGTLSGQLQTNTESIGTATSTSEFMIGGTYTSANNNVMTVNGTHASSITGGQNVIQVTEAFNPSGASVSSINGITSNPRITASNTLAPSTFISVQAQLTTLAGYAPTITNGYDYYAQDFTQGGTNPLTAFQEFFASGVTNGNGITSGTVTNYGFRYNPSTASAASGGTINNYGFQGQVPTGSGAGTTLNRGLYITGNGGSGGAGTTTNWSIYDDSTANIVLRGNTRFGGTTTPSFAVDATGDVNASGALRQAGTAIATGAFLISDTDTTLAANSNSNVATQKAVKTYVDAHSAGLNYKSPVATSTTANITLSGEQTLDGVLTSSSRVLVKNQTTTSQNGIYASSSGAWSRTTDATSAADLLGVTVLVSAGTTQGGTQWNCGCTALTVGTSPIVFVQISLAASSYTAGTGLTLTTNQFAIDSTVVTLAGSQTLTNKIIGAGQITGALANANIPAPGVGPGNYGGVIQSLCTVHQFGNQIDGSGNLDCNRPDWSDLTGTPTTLAGYNISNGQPLSADLTAIAAIGSNGILKRTGSGAWSIATSGTDYAPATSGSSILKASSGGFANAVANTDYLAVSGPVFTSTLSSAAGSISLTAGSVNIGTGSVAITTGGFSSGGNTTTVRGGLQGVNIDGPDATYKELLYSIASTQIWTAGMDKVAESSTRTGANYEICEWSNAGTFIDCPLAIARATGIVNFVDGATVGGSNVLKASDIGSTVQAFSTSLSGLASTVSGATRGILGTPITNGVGITTLDPCLSYSPGGSGALNLTCTTLAGYRITDAAPITIYQPFVLGTQFDKAAATTPTAITGLGITAAAGKTYTFEGILFVTLDAVGAMRFRLGGLATMTSITYEASFICNSGNGTYNNAGRFTDLTTNFTLPSVGCTSGQIHYKGSAVINAGGTFFPAFGQQVASGTSSVLVNSNAEYTQVN